MNIKENKIYLIYANTMFDGPKYYVGKAKFEEDKFDFFDCGDDYIWPKDLIKVKNVEEVESWELINGGM